MADKKIKPDDMPKELQVYQQLVFLSLTTKHESWSHEKEYRIMTPFNNYFPVVPRKIFIGMKCKEKNKTKLEEIGNRFNGYCEEIIKWKFVQKNKRYKTTDKSKEMLYNNF